MKMTKDDKVVAGGEISFEGSSAQADTLASAVQEPTVEPSPAKNLGSVVAEYFHAYSTLKNSDGVNVFDDSAALTANELLNRTALHPYLRFCDDSLSIVTFGLVTLNIPMDQFLTCLTEEEAYILKETGLVNELSPTVSTIAEFFPEHIRSVMKSSFNLFSRINQNAIPEKYGVYFKDFSALRLVTPKSPAFDEYLTYLATSNYRPYHSSFGFFLTGSIMGRDQNIIRDACPPDEDVLFKTKPLCAFLKNAKNKDLTNVIKAYHDFNKEYRDIRCPDVPIPSDDKKIKELRTKISGCVIDCIKKYHPELIV